MARSNLATSNGPDNISLIKAEFLKIFYGTPINLSFLTILVERSTSNNITINPGVSDSGLKAQKPVLGRVNGTIESRVAISVSWLIFNNSREVGVVVKRIIDWDTFIGTWGKIRNVLQQIRNLTSYNNKIYAIKFSNHFARDVGELYTYVLTWSETFDY